jgi:hypothetical protein
MLMFLSKHILSHRITVKIGIAFVEMGSHKQVMLVNKLSHYDFISMTLYEYHHFRCIFQAENAIGLLQNAYIGLMLS